MTFEQIAKNYKRGLWNKKMVKIAVQKGVITEDEYFKITGEKYSA